MTLPPVKIEIAFTTQPNDPSPVYIDVTAFVDLTAGVVITRGRLDEFGAVQPGTASFTLNNTDGRFTQGYTGGANYPNVKIRRKVRISRTAATTGATVYYAFTGYIDEWPTEWPGGLAYSEAKVTAVDRFKRLGTGAELRSLVEEEIGYDGPAFYYTLGEPTGAVIAGDTSTSTLNSPLAIVHSGTGGAATFGAGTGPATDSSPAIVFAPVDYSNGKGLAGAVVGPTPTVSVLFECCVNTSSTTDGLYAGFDVTQAGVTHNIFLGQFLNKPVIEIDSAPVVTGATNINDGRTHHLAATYDITGNTTTLYVDGVSVGSAAGGTMFAVAANKVYVGGYPPTQFSSGRYIAATMAHVAYTAGLALASLPARVVAHAQAALVGFVGERSDQRVARIARYAGIPTAEQSLEVGLSTSIGLVDITGAPPVQAMQDIATTESGVIQMDGQGRLQFQSRSHRYGATSAINFAGVIDPSCRFVANDVYLKNDITASRAAGITYRAVNTASVAEYGRARDTVTLLTTSDNEVVDAANWKANATATPDSRLPGLLVDILARGSIQSAVLLLDVGSRVTVSLLPATAPATSVDLFIEGWTETMSDSVWTFAFNTSPTGLVGSVFTLNSSLLDGPARLGY